MAEQISENARTCVLDQSAESNAATLRAGLVFTADCLPGIRRRSVGGTFEYRHDAGRELSAQERARIERLHVPPAWTDVWICDDEHGHLQATGRDSKGRKQYRYHEAWRAVRDERKFDRLVEFGEVLPRIRRQVDQDLHAGKLTRAKVTALVVALLDETLIRVGNPEYLRQNCSYGLTTLRDEHAEVASTRVRLRFRGKAGKGLVARVDDRRIARAIRRVRDLPGHELFQYLDGNGVQHVIESGDVNAYLRELTGFAVTSKDFRTWGGSLTVARALHASGGAPSARAVAAAIREAAGVLGNTPAVCRRAYVHPGLVELYLSGSFEPSWSDAARSEPSRAYLLDDERVFLGILRQLTP